MNMTVVSRDKAGVALACARTPEKYTATIPIKPS